MAEYKRLGDNVRECKVMSVTCLTPCNSLVEQY